MVSVCPRGKKFAIPKISSFADKTNNKKNVSIADIVALPLKKSRLMPFPTQLPMFSRQTT